MNTYPENEPASATTGLVENGAVLGAGVTVAPFAVVKTGTTLGDGVYVDHGAVVGGLPQFIGFDPATPSGVRIGARTIIRENVTVNRSIYRDGLTSIGEDCMIMSGCHVGHDCALGNRVAFAGTVLLAGHVTVGDHVFIGGGAGVHQFCVIGESAMIGGMARITLDVPPFVTIARDGELSGLNLVGIKRRGFTQEEISDLKRCYRAVYLSKDHGSVPIKAAAARAEGVATTDRGRQFLDFFLRDSKRGFSRK